MSTRVKVVCNDKTSFYVNPETLEKWGENFYDPFPYSEMYIRTMKYDDWVKKVEQIKKDGFEKL